MTKQISTAKRNSDIHKHVENPILNQHLFTMFAYKPYKGDTNLIKTFFFFEISTRSDEHIAFYRR